PPRCLSPPPIENSRLPLSSAPTGLPEGGGIRVVFQGRGHAELPRQIFHGVVPLPAGEKVNVAKGAAKWVHDTGGSNADAADFDAGFTCRFSQHADNSLESV